MPFSGPRFSASSVDDAGAGSITIEGTSVVVVVKSVDAGSERFLRELLVKLFRAEVDGRRDRRSFFVMDDSSGISSSLLG